MELLRSFNTVDIDIRKGDGDRVREFIISTSRKDGHGTIVPHDKWDIEDYNRAGAFYYQHQTGSGWFTDANPDNALGPATARVEGDRLIGSGTFEPKELNELAEKIMGKVDFGTMRATSVGFIPYGGHWGNEKLGEDPTAYYFDGQILKEWSIVHIPSNPDAIKKALEPMDKYLLKEAENHTSEGFRKDFQRAITAQKRADLLIHKLFIK